MLNRRLMTPILPGSGKGVILIPETMSVPFAEEIDQFEEGTPIAVYFWFHAKEFELRPMPREIVGENPLSLHEVLGLLKEYHTDIISRWRQHMLDNDRKSLDV